MYIALEDGAGLQTLLVRRTRLEVKESAILRWMGSLGATAMSDFQGRTEAEENRFLHDAFAALRSDLQDVLPAREETPPDAGVSARVPSGRSQQ